MKARVIPSQRETAMLYRLPAEEREGAEIRRLLSQYQIAARDIPADSLGQTIASFLERRAAVPGAGAPYTGPVILFSGVEAKKQQTLLQALREEGVGRAAIKAVVTPSNRSWTFEKLFAELAEEHARMTERRRPDEIGKEADGGEG